MTEGWREIATLGHDDSIGGEVLCAWLAEDASHVWLFDDEGALHRVDLATRTHATWPMLPEDRRIEGARWEAEFFGESEPFLWLFSETDPDDRWTKVYRCSASGPALCATLGEGRSRFRRDSMTTGARSAVLRHDFETGRSCVYAPDGTLRVEFTANDDRCVCAVGRNVYWRIVGERRRETLQCLRYDRSVITSFEGRWSDSMFLGQIGDDRLVFETYRGVLLVDAEQEGVRKIESELDLMASYEVLRGDMCVHPHWFAPDAMIGALERGFALQRWDSNTVEPLALSRTARVRHVDKRFIVATERCGVVLIDRRSGEVQRSDYASVERVAFAADRSLVATYEDKSIRWWRWSRNELLAMDAVSSRTQCELVGVRNGGTCAVFIESHSEPMELIVERSFDQGELRSVARSGLFEANISVLAMSERWTLVCSRKRGRLEGPVEYLSLLSATGQRWDWAFDRVIACARILDDNATPSIEWRFDGAENGVVQVVTWTNGAVRVLEEWDEEPARSVVAADYGLVAVLRDGQLRVGAQSFEWRIDPNGFVNVPGRMAMFAVARSAARLAYPSDANRTVYALDWERGILTRIRVSESQDAIRALALSDDGRRVAVGLATGVVRVFEFD
ncbi:MAG: hypothetical protein JNK05_27970 [Myxococcales bacterium]|nr:hypothetical protein [Myxococcales bacterium]